MQPLLIRKDGSSLPLTEEQYRQVLDTLGLEEDSPKRTMTDEEIDALLDEVQNEAATWDISTDDLLEERRREREIERNREKRYGIP